MKLKPLLKLSFSELVRFKSITLFLVLNLSLGLIGFFLLQIFQQSLSAQSAEKAQAVLGGDISISARRGFSDSEREEWEQKFKFTGKTRFYSMFSMLRTDADARLVSVGAFDSQFPLYGQFKFSDSGFTNDRPRIWVDPEVEENMNLKPGQEVEIGEQKFLYSGVILEDPSRLFRGVGFAPRVFIHNQFLATTGLIKFGSTFSEYWTYKVNPAENIEKIKADLENLIQDPVVRIESTKDSADDSNRVLKYFTDYLGLVALVALGLCFLCGSYLLQWTFLTKKKSIAIYKTLGLTDRKIIFIYLLQNFVISLAACFIAFSIVKALQPSLQFILNEKFNLPLILTFNLKAAFVIGLIAVLGPMLIVVPQIIQIIDLRPLTLLQNVQTTARRGAAYFIWLILSVILFWGLAVWQSHSYKIASIFTGSLVGLIILFRYINLFLLYLLEKFSKNNNWLLRYSIKGLTRKQASATLVFTTMSLATLVLSLLPHVKTSIINEIKPSNASQVPSLFLFDIQPEQVASLQKLSENILKQPLKLSPLVRSRILKINDDRYERVVQNGEAQTRESEQAARSRNRGLNLTYRDHLQDSETLTQGVFSQHFEADKLQAMPEISIEANYAQRMNINLNDVITFDVQGVELKAKVSSFRQVRWTSFQPNFFILFPTGVLEEAPQNFLTSVANIDKGLVKQFQRQVSLDFKNVSIVDVTRTIENSMKYIDQMSIGLQFMAWLAVLVGIFVFIVLLNTQIKERLQEMNLLQILGTPAPSVLRIVLSQFVILITTSILFGVISGFIMAWVLISFFFKIQTQYDIQYLFLLALVLFPVCSAALIYGLRPLKKLNPVDLIRQA